jgi:hypothetical protein
MWGNTVANPQCFKKKTTKLNSEPAPYLKNKINKNNSEKKTQKNEKKDNFGKKNKNKMKKNEKQNIWVKLKLNSQLAQY